jgi:hypothetical protein
VRETSYRGGPQDVSLLRDAPFEGQVLPIGDAFALGSAELGPILGDNLGRKKEKERGTKQGLLLSLLG